jgi:uncharacterized protein (UPF0332 family)
VTPIQALLAKAGESLGAARLLADAGYHDFAVSRSYYTMFYVAEAFLLSRNLAYSKHAAVIAAFGQQFAKTGDVPVEFHRYLIEGQDSRNIGDYDLAVRLGRDEAEQQIKRAEEFLAFAKKSLPSRERAPGQD